MCVRTAESPIRMAMQCRWVCRGGGCSGVGGVCGQCSCWVLCSLLRLWPDVVDVVDQQPEPPSLERLQGSAELFPRQCPPVDYDRVRPAVTGENQPAGYLAVAQQPPRSGGVRFQIRRADLVADL